MQPLFQLALTASKTAELTAPDTIGLASWEDSMDRFFSCAPGSADTVTASAHGSEHIRGSSARTIVLSVKALFGLCALAFVLIFSSHTSRAAEMYNWRIGHVRPEGSAIHSDTKWLADRIYKETDGKINITIYPRSILGDYTIAQEKTSFGGIDMYIGPFGTMTNRSLILPNIPYLVTDWFTAKKVFSPGSVLMDTMEKLLEAQNIKLLGGWPVYFGGIVLTEEPAKPADPSVSKDMIIRVPPARSFALAARELGYTPYPITWVYAKEGLKTGMVKGIMGGGAEGYEGLGNLAKYYVAAKDHFEYWFVYMNLDLWKGLSEKEKRIIQNAVREMEARRYEVAEAEEAASIERLRNQGTKIINLTDEQILNIKEKFRQNVWPLIRQDIGPVFDEVVSSTQENK